MATPTRTCKPLIDCTNPTASVADTNGYQSYQASRDNPGNEAPKHPPTQLPYFVKGENKGK